ncbi:HD domain-containing protein [Lutibaculum baratangense]|uniref:HD domain-containing protein n=1 Tax=Lutibaculum baratangense TaxID=1358440 RepID=UPI001AEC422A|nr:HD domain-containing protein [Lutibaculum baratangense]
MDDPLRERIAAELPELGEIRDAELKAGCIEAWAVAIANSSYGSIADIPPAGNPEKMIQKSGDQTDHIRGVTRLSIVIADEMASSAPDLPIDRDILVAGGICHDVGKPWEFDPENRRRWKGDRARHGLPSLRHPTYGAHICLIVGLPEEVAHIAAGHSGEGELMIRSLENTIVHMADIGYWQIMLAGGMIQDGTISDKYKRPLSL